MQIRLQIIGTQDAPFRTNKDPTNPAFYEFSTLLDLIGVLI